MSSKTPGKLNPPPAQADFNKFPLAGWCVPIQGVFYRLRSIDKSGKPWPAIFFSCRDCTRFDPAAGPGTLYVGDSLAGVLMEIFDDSWGAVGCSSRSLTRTQLGEWWVSLVAVPTVSLFRAGAGNLSKIGTDMQLLTGDHALARAWALSLASHPAKIDGIHYRSRHDDSRFNLGIFKQRPWASVQFDATLHGPASGHHARIISPADPLVYGPDTLLQHHPELLAALTDLDVAILP